MTKITKIELLKTNSKQRTEILILCFNLNRNNNYHYNISKKIKSDVGKRNFKKLRQYFKQNYHICSLKAILEQTVK